MRILGEIDLDDLLTKPSSTFYRFLISIKKAVFEDDERIILRAYNDLPSDLIEHLIWAINYTDIPEYFIILETNSQKNKDALASIKNQPLYKSKTLIDHGSTPRFDHLSLCGHMYAGLHVWPDGTVSPCCDYTGSLKDSKGLEYTIHEHKLSDIFNSESMEDLRRQMTSQNKPSGCITCFEQEASGRESRRTLAPYRLDNLYGEINWESDNPIRYIGSHPTNHCNLSCRICNSMYSSVIEAEDRQQGKVRPKIKRAIDPLYDQMHAMDEIKSFEILGGEPFVMNRHLDFMKHIISNGVAERSTFQFTTNGTVFPDFFLERPKFKRLEITFSIDDINDRFEYQRNKAHWKNVLDNIESFKQLRDGKNDVKLGINITVSILNVFYLPELIEWFESSGLDHHNFTILTKPKYLAIGNMTDQARVLVLSKLDSRFDFIKYIIKSSEGSDGRDFVSNIKMKDALRNQDFRTHHSDIARAMGYN